MVANQALITKYPFAAFYLMPQLKDTTYNASVYNAQLAQGYRVKYDPTGNPATDPQSAFLAQLYIAAGISGAVQHRVGMEASDVIIAINTDANAPIFDIAHYGIVGNAMQVLPALTQAFAAHFAQHSRKVA